MDKNLEQFMAIADSGSYSAAADALHVSQPALSYNLKKLEAKLGVTLFNRTSRGVRLTSYGEILYENTQMMMRLYSNAVDTIARQKAGLEEIINIGTGYSTWNLFLREMVVGLAKDEPNTPINVSLGNELRCMEQLLAGELALFVGHQIRNLAKESVAQFLPLGEATAAYYVRADHPLLGQPRTRSEVREFPSVHALTREARQERLLSPAKRHRLFAHQERHPDFVSNSLNVCLDYLRETDGVLYHSRLIRSMLLERDIHTVPMQNGEVRGRWTMGIYVQDDRRADPKVQQIIDTLLANRDRILDRLG